MRAIISDVHGNLEALHAVLNDIIQQRGDAIYCVGDLVDFGPNPRECVELAMQWQVVLLGDHDQAATAEPEDSILRVHQGLVWTRDQLAASVENGHAAQQRLQFLANRPSTYREADFLFVHASPRDPLCDFVFPEDVYCAQKMESLFSLIPHCCFSGHTHYPGVFTEDHEFFNVDEIGPNYHLSGKKTLVNVGSVGQPRDGDWRACYVLFDGETVHFRRVEYDVEATVRKIYATSGLENIQGDRLRAGR